MTATVVVVADDPGGANALAPIIRRLLDTAIGRVEVAAFPGAREVLEREGVESRALPAGSAPEAVEDLLPGASLLLTGTSGYGDAERLLRRAAAARGLPTVAVLDFWNTYRERFAGDDGSIEQPDRILVMDEVARQGMVAAGFDEARIVVTGHPAHDRLVGLRPAFPLRPAPGATGPARVLFLSQPWRFLTAGDPTHVLHPGYDEVEALGMVARSLDRIGTSHRLPITLTVRPHPREEDIGATVATLEPSPWVTVTIDGARTPLESFEGTDLVVGMTTAALIDACILGLPVVSFQPGHRLPDPLPITALGSARLVEDGDGLGPALEALLLDDAARQALHRAALAFPASGHASERAVAVVEELLATS